MKELDTKIEKWDGCTGNVQKHVENFQLEKIKNAAKEWNELTLIKCKTRTTWLFLTIKGLAGKLRSRQIYHINIEHVQRLGKILQSDKGIPKYTNIYHDRTTIDPMLDEALARVQPT